MKPTDTQPLWRFLNLALGVLKPPAGAWRIAVAFSYGVLCHLTFAVAVLSMIIAMFFGMSQGFGRVPGLWAILANVALIAQFPPTLSTTTYAIVASVQLLALFTLWTPSGIIWWQADGAAFTIICVCYGVSWLLLSWASYDAGAEVQSGALGWMSLAQNIRPVFPDMPTKGLFSIIRQPIYVSFALTTWTVPFWTPDQLFLALSLTTYCLLAPRLKERRFGQRYGDQFEAYKRDVPYAMPRAPMHQREP